MNGAASNHSTSHRSAHRLMISHCSVSDADRASFAHARVRAEQRERRLNAVKDTALRAFGMARKSQVVEGKGSPLRMLMAKELGRRQTASGAPAPARIPASSGELSPPTRLDSVARGRNTASCSQPSGAAMVSFANS